MQIWVPTKDEIERILRDMADSIKISRKISDIEKFLDDTLSELDCHVTNRANVERGVIHE